MSIFGGMLIWAGIILFFGFLSAILLKKSPEALTRTMVTLLCIFAIGLITLDQIGKMKKEAKKEGVDLFNPLGGKSEGSIKWND